MDRAGSMDHSSLRTLPRHRQSRQSTSRAPASARIAIALPATGLSWSSSASRSKARATKDIASCVLLPRPDVNSKGDLNLPEALVRDVDQPTTMSSERLIIFDYDGTITIDKDQKSKGLIGHRLARLQDMMLKVKASDVRCVLVTAQFPIATQEITIPALQRSGLSVLFEDESSGSHLRLYWDDADHGTIYNGAKVMMGKIDLINKIIEGDNCWAQSFAPSEVLFIDDDARNFKGNEKLGIQTHHVAQDGMVDDDMAVVEAFAQQQ